MPFKEPTGNLLCGSELKVEIVADIITEQFLLQSGISTTDNAVKETTVQQNNVSILSSIFFSSGEVLNHSKHFQITEILV